MKWLQRMRRDRRGAEIRHLVPDMLKYVKQNYVPRVQLKQNYKPRVQYSIDDSADIQFCLPSSFRDENADVLDAQSSPAETEKHAPPCAPPALDTVYHAWEKENSEYRSFSSEVVRMVNERFRKTSDFYRSAGIDKRTFHKIRSDFGYKPSRMTAFRCCIGLKLNAEEAEALLRLAGMAFSPNDPDDLVLKFCLENGIRDIPGINYMLYRYATRPLS